MMSEDISHPRKPKGASRAVNMPNTTIMSHKAKAQNF